MNPKTLLTQLLLLCTCCTYAQFGNGPFGKNPNNFVPASPEAAAFQRYGDLPVSVEYGTANISVPLGSINLKSFSWPISLSYHTGGNKLGDVASSAGLGWVLNAHGTTSYKVVGNSGYTEPERRFLSLYSVYDNGSYEECDYVNEDDINTAENVVAGATDFVPDLKYINTPLFNLKAIGDMYFPSTDIKPCSGSITIGGLTHNYGNGLQDAKGNRYYFGLSTYNFTVSCYSQSGTPVNTGNVLTKILTFDGGLITFEYDTVTFGYSMLPTQYRTFVSPDQCQRCNFEIGGDNQSCNSTYTTKEAYLTKIESSNGDVVRVYYSPRSDLTGGKKIDSVLFKRKINGIEETLRKFVLVHGYFGAGSDPEDFRLKLTELALYNNNAAHINSYFFDYDTMPLPNRVTSKAIDWWGYYNGQTGNTTLIADQAGRDGNVIYARACILNKLTYPTGGYTTLEYEMNPFGGLRVKKLKDYDGLTSTVKEKSLNYHTAPGNGTNNGMVFEDFLVTNFLATDYITGEFDVEDEHMAYLLACYTKRVNSSPVTSNLMSLIENVNYYSQVTEYFGADSANGKIVYTFGNNHLTSGGAYAVPNITMLTKKTYRRNGGSFDIISELHNLYDPVHPDTNSTFADPEAPFEQRVWVRDISKLRDETSYNMVVGMGILHWCKAYIDNIYCISAMPIKLTRTIEKTYEPGTSNVIIDTTRYFYDDNNNMRPTRIRKTNSTGDEVVIRYTYPTGSVPLGVSLTAPEENALDALIDQNLQNNPYYIEVLKNNTVISKQLNTYQETQGLPVLKKEKEYPTAGFDFFEYQYNSYDSRINITDFRGKDNANQAMLYDSSSNLLARCINCQGTEMAYTSFETGFTGNWSGISNTYVQSSGGLTGDKYYNQTGFNLSRSGLTSGRYYTVTYWSSNGSYSISGTQSGYPKAIGTVTHTGNTWILFEHLVTGQSTITISGSGGIDELRLLPREGMMTTYCYAPSIGMITSCDAAGRLTYYAYDEIGRLKLVMDQHKNVLKKYEYRYSSQ
ncbi:MAG TPA: hypothetical protein VD996_17180 [Chitinophagaceae bacterium]|nr:hypothetical protein [Chitinophagaceae bacterium]